MDNQISVRFFRISPVHDAAPTPEDALHMALIGGATPKARERGIPPDAIVRLERLSEDGTFLDGEIVRRQMANFPPEANDDGLAQLPLSDGSGIGHCVAFRYSKGLRVIAIQFDNRAVSIGRLLSYLRACDATADFRSLPLVRSDAWERYGRGEPRKFSLRIADPSLPAVEGDVYDVNESSKRLAEIFNGPIVSIEVSMGRRRGSLSRAAVDWMVEFFTQGAGKDEDVRKLSVDVQPPEGGAAEPVDFIEELLTVKKRIEVPEHNPEAHYSIRRQFVTSCFNDNLDHIIRMYGGQP